MNRDENINWHLQHDISDNNQRSDIVLYNINPRGISKEGNVEIKSYPGLASEDIMDTSEI